MMTENQETRWSQQRRECLSRAWIKLAETIESNRHQKLWLTEAAEAILKDEATPEQRHSALNGLSKGFSQYGTEDTYKLGKPYWLFAQWLDFVESSPDSRLSLYFAAENMIYSHGNPQLPLPALKEHGLSHIFNQHTALIEDGKREIVIYTLKNLYKKDLYRPQDKVTLETILLDELNRLEEAERTGEGRCTSRFVEIVDVAMMKSGNSPFLKRANEIRQGEILRDLANTPERIRAFGHAASLLSAMKPASH